MEPVLFVSAHISTFLRIAASVLQAYALMRLCADKVCLARALVLYRVWLKAIGPSGLLAAL